ncbi:MAG TPA: EfeM/EfeO family lipoprotein [Acidimicrobiia bacterium]|nr:EfeM/EfeO family lipoprotein [Acidimicrobiia bacterium]
MWNRARTRREIALAAAVLIALVALAAMLVSAFASSPGDAPNSIRVGDDGCADAWHAPRSGVRTFTVHNDAHNAVDVELVGARAPRVFGSLEVVAAGASRDLVVRLPPGHYQWKCDFATGATLLSRAEAVAGHSLRGVVASEPVTEDELTPVATDVRDRTLAALQQLAAETDGLRAAVVDGRLADARAAWLAAHLAYERLGVAYGTFGDFDARIDGRPDGLPGGVGDPHWTGFLRLEHGLWGGEALPGLATVATRLAADVHALIAAFPGQFTDIRDVPLRAHEILENTLQFQLTGDADQGSHTVLATARANVDGTRAVLEALDPLLRSRAPKLAAESTRVVDELASLLDAYRRADGTWLGLADLTARQREMLDGRFGAVLETLAPVPDVLELPRDAGQE